MKEHQPGVYLARHGETAWSLSGRHTGLMDLPLTGRGRRNARRPGELLEGLTFARVLPSPSERAGETCGLAGFQTAAQVEPGLVEWDYGDYEGRDTVEIHLENPGWQLFRDACPGGKTPVQVAVRAGQILQQIRAVQGDVLIFSSGHFLRMLGARWLGLEPFAGKFFQLDTASVNALSYENYGSKPVIRLWNDCRHAGD